MRKEYILSTSARAELRNIDDQIEQLLMRKCEIYNNAPVRYLIDEDEIDINDCLKTDWNIMRGILADKPLIPKHAIAKLVFTEE